MSLAEFRDELEVACEVDAGQSPTQEMLNKLRRCTRALEDFAEKTKKGLRRTIEANEKFGVEYGNVMSLLAMLKDAQSIEEAFKLDQTQAMHFLQGDAAKVESDIGVRNTTADNGGLGLGSTSLAFPGSAEPARAAPGSLTEPPPQLDAAVYPIVAGDTAERALPTRGIAVADTDGRELADKQQLAGHSDLA